MRGLRWQPSAVRNDDAKDDHRKDLREQSSMGGRSLDLSRMQSVASTTGQTAATAATALTTYGKRSALRSQTGAPKRRLRKNRHVRFKGMTGPATAWMLQNVVLHFRTGSNLLVYWSFILALLRAMDFVTLPIAIVLKVEAEVHLKHHEGGGSAHGLNVLIAFVFAIDAFFILDVMVQAGQAIVTSLDLDELPAEKVVRVASPKEHRHEWAKLRQKILHQYASAGTIFGPSVRRVLMVGLPKEMLLIVPLWLTYILHLKGKFQTALYFFRVYRVWGLFKYFSARQEDVSADVRRVAFFK